MKYLCLIILSFYSMWTSAAPVTISYLNGDTNIAYGTDGTANYLVSANSDIPFPITLSYQPLNNSWAIQSTSLESACPGVPACTSVFTLTANQSCCLMLDLDVTNLAVGNYLLSPVVSTTPATYSYTVSSPTPVSVGYSVGGTVTGLTDRLTLLNNGTDLTTSTDGDFIFSDPVATGSPYAVTVKTHPTGMTCTVNDGTGIMGSENVTDVEVTCSDNEYTVGGTISGLVGTVTLLNNDNNPTSISSNGPFRFSTLIAEGSEYDVSVKTQPANQTCSVSGRTGVITANVNNVNVTCSPNTYTLGGTISNLVGTVTLLNNDTNPTRISTNGSFRFSDAIASGSSYRVTIQTQPASQTCSVVNGSGTINSNLDNVVVTCLTQNTILSVPPTGTIPFNTGTGTLTVRNIGQYQATNVKAELPGGWTGVTQNSTACQAINPGHSCTLTFTSTRAYVAQGNIKIIGDNINSPPTTALAFTVNNYLVWMVSGNRAQVIDNADLPTMYPWGRQVNITNTIPNTNGAYSTTDGVTNTLNIVNTPNIGSSAAIACNSSTNGGYTAGTWYLPANCRIGAQELHFCQAGLANITTNLSRLGFGGLLSDSPYWSSTASTWQNPRNGMYVRGGANGGNYRYALQSVRCAREFTL